MAMSKLAAWTTAVGCFVGMILCLIGWRNHRPRRARLAGEEGVSIGGWRCEECGKVADSLDAFGEPGYVSVDRPIHSRDEAGGRGTITRDGTRDGTGVG